MKRVVKAATGEGMELLLGSDLFDLYRKEGVGQNDTPYTSYQVRSKGEAEYYAVEIRLDLSWEKFEGTPVEYEVEGVRIVYGLTGRRNTDSDIRKFMEVLKEALKFEIEIRNYLQIG